MIPYFLSLTTAINEGLKGFAAEPCWGWGGWAVPLGMLGQQQHAYLPTQCPQMSKSLWLQQSPHVGDLLAAHMLWQVFSCSFGSASNNDFKTLNHNCGQLSNSLCSRIHTMERKTQRMHSRNVRVVKSHHLSCSQGWIRWLNSENATFWEQARTRVVQINYLLLDIINIYTYNEYNEYNEYMCLLVWVVMYLPSHSNDLWGSGIMKALLFSLYQLNSLYWLFIIRGKRYLIIEKNVHCFTPDT